MNNKKSKKGLVIFLVLLAVVLMTIGFAAYTQNLTINGQAAVTASSWKVRYNSTKGVVPTSNSNVTANPETISTNDTKFEFTVTLAKPGDVYEVQIYPHNYGTLDAYLTSIDMSGPNADQAKYLSYTIDYGGTTYTGPQTGITGKKLAANGEETVKVKLAYILPESASDLPATNQTITISGNLGYSSQDTAQQP